MTVAERAQIGQRLGAGYNRADPPVRGVLPGKSSNVPKETPRWLTALGRRDLPREIDVAGDRCALRRVFKNDFFAVTALYEGDGRRVILKVARQAWLGLLPLAWVGRLLAAREQACLTHLADVEGVPRFFSRWERTGIIREYVPGHALQKGERVEDGFHDRLRRCLDRMHDRGMAYVDLEKCENVLVGDDGNPYLFDFQISWYLPRLWGGELWPARWIRGKLQNADRYHLRKIMRRTRPDLLSSEELAASYRKPWYVRLHALVTRPFTIARRWFLGKVDPRKKQGERGRVDDDGLVGVKQ